MIPKLRVFITDDDGEPLEDFTVPVPEDANELDGQLLAARLRHACLTHDLPISKIYQALSGEPHGIRRIHQLAEKYNVSTEIDMRFTIVGIIRAIEKGIGQS